MSKSAVNKKAKPSWTTDESYDRYKRPRWQPVLLLAAGLVLVLAIRLETYQPHLLLLLVAPSSILSLDQRVVKIMSLTPLIDGHNDLAERVRFHFHNHIYSSDFRSKFENGGMPEHFDLPRMITGRQGGFFWSCWVDCPKDGLDFSNENYAPVVIEALAQMDVIHRLQAARRDIFSPASLDSTSALSAFRRGGKLLSPIGLEGLHMVGRNASTLRLFDKLGVKYATLTWNCHNAFADAAQVTVLDDSLDPEAARPAKPYWGGLSLLGTQLIREMNRLGMMIDLSHTHPATMHDVLAGNATKSFPGSRAPVIFSHSSAHALCPHPRNVPDHILPLVKQTNSVVMVTFVPQFISCVNATVPDRLPMFYPANSTLEWVAEHIMYIGKKIGFEHVGIGSDFDGIPSTPRGLEDVSKFPALVKQLLRQGLSDGQVAGVIGGNVLRVWKGVEEISREMLQEGVLPMEDDI
ncbi:membrane dipeptidase [Cladophialophora yegresii CBS 114405]|uniref:Dipeptidase n=1 Tax=Cladophialophora yegresii CBS 114405 TaxID=1182544 RepID=W9W7Q1_9EURO|nr:membrane dipeptidase [Cladophialophora yegresii CBS 114405]EXJ61020.1 membrane dipeptidase [Cladophialophora yegresii CBS 114405]